MQDSDGGTEQKTGEDLPRPRARYILHWRRLLLVPLGFILIWGTSLVAGPEAAGVVTILLLVGTFAAAILKGRWSGHDPSPDSYFFGYSDHGDFGGDGGGGDGSGGDGGA